MLMLMVMVAVLAGLPWGMLMIASSMVMAMLMFMGVAMRGAFYYHAWPGVFVGDAKSTVDGKSGMWIPVDPTLNQFPADVSHVRLARGGFDRQTAILPLLGRAKIRVVSMVDAPGGNNTRPLVGADRKDTPSLALDFPAPQSKDSCWRRPAPRR